MIKISEIKKNKNKNNMIEKVKIKSQCQNLLKALNFQNISHLTYI